MHRVHAFSARTTFIEFGEHLRYGAGAMIQPRPTPFSERHGYELAEPEITVREDAPETLRFAIAQIAVDAGMSPSAIRNVTCSVLFTRPDPSNWSEYPNIWEEVLDLLQQCAWFQVYDIAEAIYRALQPNSAPAETFKTALNRFFRMNGIGWELTYDGIIFRGDPAFSMVTRQASELLFQSGRPNAANEIREALRDASRRPTPDLTGAIQHVMAALESTARDVLRQPNATLGALIPLLDLPKPLDQAVDKLWGFASDKARHMREGNKVDDVQVELIVSTACAVCIFLAKRAVT
jgi:hypothetical protein